MISLNDVCQISMNVCNRKDRLRHEGDSMDPDLDSLRLFGYVNAVISSCLVPQMNMLTMKTAYLKCLCNYSIFYNK